MGYVERYVYWSNFSRENWAKSTWPGIDQQHHIPSVSPDELEVGPLFRQHSGWVELFHFLRALEEWQSSTAGIHNKIRTQFGHNPCMSVYHTYGTRKYLLADATDEFDLPMVGILGRCFLYNRMHFLFIECGTVTWQCWLIMPSQRTWGVTTNNVPLCQATPAWKS